MSRDVELDFCVYCGNAKDGPEIYVRAKVNGRWCAAPIHAWCWSEWAKEGKPPIEVTDQ